jgi:hypothetical protein
MLNAIGCCWNISKGHVNLLQSQQQRTGSQATNSRCARCGEMPQREPAN